MPLDTPQFGLPFRLGPDGAPLEVEQDSLEEVAACVEVLIRTPLGFHDDLPDYGVDLPLFEEGVINTNEIEAAISTWEERADTLIESEPDLLDQMISRVNVNVSTRSDA